MQMIVFDAVELRRTSRRCRKRRGRARLELLLDMLHAVVQSEHPYAYLVATEPRSSDERGD